MSSTGNPRKFSYVQGHRSKVNSSTLPVWFRIPLSEACWSALRTLSWATYLLLRVHHPARRAVHTSLGEGKVKVVAGCRPSETTRC